MQTIIQDILSLFLSFVNSVIAGIISLCMNGFLDNSFTPSVDKFSELFGMAGLDTLCNFFAWVGGILTIAFLGIHGLMFLASGVEELKDSIPSLLTRTLFCIILIFGIREFGDEVLKLGQVAVEKTDEFFGSPADTQDYGVFGESVLDEGMATLGNDTGTLANDMLSAVEVGDEISLFSLEMDAEALVEITGIWVEIMEFAIVVIIRIIILLVCAYNLIKLIVELVSRYMMMMILYCGLAGIVPFYGSANTQNVFYTYLKMFGTEVGVLVLTRAWISMSFYMFTHIKSSIITVFCFVAFVRIGVRMEQLLKDMGLSTTSMGGALLDSVVMTAGVMAMGMSRVSGMAGGALINAGALTGNMKMGRVGSVLSGRGASDGAVARAMNESLGGAIRDAYSYKGMNSLAKLAAQNKLGTQAALDVLSAANRSGKNGRQALTNGVLDSVYGGAKDFVKNNNLGTLSANGTLNRMGGLGVTLTNKNGSIGGVISSQKGGPGITSLPFNDINGDQMYMNFPANMSENFTSAELMKGTPDGKAHMNKFLGEGADANEFTYSMDDGYASIINNKNNLLGVVSSNGSEYYPTLQVGDDGELLHADAENPHKFDFEGAVGLELRDDNGRPILMDDGKTHMTKSSIEVSKEDARKLNVASEFCGHGESFQYGDANYANTGVGKFSGVYSAENINVDSIVVNDKTGVISVGTKDGNTIELVPATENYKRFNPNAQTVGDKNIGTYFVTRGRVKGGKKK